MNISSFQRKLRHRQLLSPKLLIICCAFAIAVPAAFAWAQHAHPAPQNSAPVVGAAAVPFELKTLDGKAAGLAAFRGKPLVLNFFASWCDPCREEMPLMRPRQ